MLKMSNIDIFLVFHPSKRILIIIFSPHLLYVYNSFECKSQNMVLFSSELAL